MGVENTWLVRTEAAERLTITPQEIAVVTPRHS